MAAPAAVRTRLWVDGQLKAENFPLADVSEHLHESGALVWADLFNPDRAELDHLADELGFDHHAVEEVVEHTARTKATRYADPHLRDRLRHRAGPAGSRLDRIPVADARRCRSSCCRPPW